MLDWRKLGTPPLPGGLLDQEAGFLRRARHLEVVFETARNFYTGDGSDLRKPGHADAFYDALKIYKGLL